MLASSCWVGRRRRTRPSWLRTLPSSLARRTKVCTSRTSTSCSAKPTMVSSARRSRRAISPSRFSAIWGLCCKCSKKSSRGSDRSSAEVIATTVAERGAPSSNASSPKTSPGRRMASVSSRPLSPYMTTLTRPESTTNKPSAGCSGDTRAVPSLPQQCWSLVVSTSIAVSESPRNSEQFCSA